MAEAVRPPQPLDKKAGENARPGFRQPSNTKAKALKKKKGKKR